MSDFQAHVAAAQYWFDAATERSEEIARLSVELAGARADLEAESAAHCRTEDYSTEEYTRSRIELAEQKHAMDEELAEARDEAAQLRVRLASQKHLMGKEWADEYAEAARLREENGNLSERLVKLAKENARLRTELATTDKIAWQNFANYRDAVDIIRRVQDALGDTTGTARDALTRVAEALEETS